MCLLAAAIMLPMIAIEIDEVMAMIQHMFDSKRRGENLWLVFWKGGSPEGCTEDKRTVSLMKFPQQPIGVLKSSVWGLSIPWSLAFSAIIGIWLMFSPTVFETGKPAADVSHLGGALVVVVAGICIAEVVRIGRYLNVLLGFGIAVLPWIINGSSFAAQINSLICGVAIAVLALPRGPKLECYGMWEHYIR